MKALTYNGPFDVRYESVPDAVCPGERGALVRVRAAGICGSDLHIYEGHGFSPTLGYCVGHEAIGEVIEVGSAVERFRVGDGVLLPASVGCGRCDSCRMGVVVGCTNPGEGGCYGLGHALGGCQAEAVAVPAADMNLVAIPGGMSDDTALMLTDNLPTARYGARMARVAPGDVVAVVGLGPVGQMAVASAFVMGASRVLAVDLLEDRRKRAVALGAEGVGGNALEEVFVLTAGRGADAVIEAVGADATINLAAALAGRSGRVSVVGVNQNPEFTFDMRFAQLKCLEFTIGLCSIQRELPALLALVGSGRLDPGAVVTHRVPLSEGPDAYAMFHSRDDDVCKVVLET